MDDALRGFYTSLLKSESRHFMDYISLAKGLEDANVVEERLALFCSVEKELIESEDAEIRFHSGVPRSCN